MMEELSCKLLVVGAGPAGYVCAIRAGQLDVDTIIVDREKLGGTCLNVGCIPSKALIHAADKFEMVTKFSKENAFGISASPPKIDFKSTINWKNDIVTKLNTGVSSLLKSSKVKVIKGSASFKDGKTVLIESTDGIKQVKAEVIVIATGSKVIELPNLPFGDDIISSSGALSLKELPDRLAVIGAGYIGLELGIAFAKLGTQVTFVEAARKILPQYDEDLTAPVRQKIESLGIDIQLGARAKKWSDGKLEFELEDGELKDIECNKVLVAVGRQPNLHGLKIDELSLAMNGPFIGINEACETSMRGVYAIGDVTGDPMLAHRATAQGEMVAEIIAGNKQVWDKECIPEVCFTDPEIVSVGVQPSEINIEDFTVSKFPFYANGKALTADADEGFIRVVARKGNHQIVGIQAVGHGVSELSAAFALTIEMQARLEDVSSTVFAHPTQSEGFLEAAMRGLGKAIHI